MTTRHWVLKQAQNKLHEDVRATLDDLIVPPIGEAIWRGPSNPRSEVFDVPEGDLVIVWDTRLLVVWEANVSLGRTSQHEWFDYERHEWVSGPGLEMVRIGGYPCEVTAAEYDAIVGPRNAAGRPKRARRTLHPLPPEHGAAMWHRIVQGVSERFIDGTDPSSIGWEETA
jgi:hypothetical protein